VLRRACLLLVVAAVPAGCGASNRGPYRLDPTRACLRDAGARVKTSGLGVIAESAPNGALRAFLGPRNVTISFARENRGARGLARAYRRFGPKGTRDLMFVSRNAVLVWDVTPDADTRASIEDCLKS
jgi:hypothetical protein